MSRILSSFGRCIINQYAQVPLHTSYVVNHACRRSLFTAEYLGIGKLDDFQERRSRAFSDDKERYIERIRKYSESADFTDFLKEDFINLLALAENEDHLDLVEKLVASEKLKDFDLSGWGATLARLYYKMNLIDRAYNIIRDPNHSLQTFMDQRTTKQIVMTMLFDAGRYDDLIALFDLIKEAPNVQDDPSKLRSYVPLVMASYAKIGTPEALEKATELDESLKDHLTHRGRNLTTLSYIAYMNGKYVFAINLLADRSVSNRQVSNNLKVLCLMNLKRYEDVLIFLRDTIRDLQERNLKILCQDVYDRIKGNLDTIDDDNIRHQFTEILNDIAESKLISEKNLEDLVFSPIKLATRLAQRFDGNFEQRDTRFSNRGDRMFNNRPRDSYQYRRPGVASDTYSGRQDRRRISYNQDEE